MLITFYRRNRSGRIELLRRYIRRWREDNGYVPWTGTYAELADELFLGAGEIGILVG